MLGDTMTQWVVTADDRSLRYITPPALVSPSKNPGSGGLPTRKIMALAG